LWYLGMGVTLVDPAFNLMLRSLQSNAINSKELTMGASSNYPSEWTHIKIEGRLSLELHCDIASDMVYLTMHWSRSTEVGADGI